MPKKHETWMPLYIADYLADTMHLNAEQHGAYMLMLMAAWKAGGELPDDDAQLSTITRTGDRWQTHVKRIVIAFFTQSDGKLIHNRVSAELIRAKENISKRSAAGKAGATAKWQKDGKRIATAMREQRQNDGTSPSPITTSTDVEVVVCAKTAPTLAAPDSTASTGLVETGSPEPKEPAKRPTRKCPETFAVTPDMIDWAKREAPLVSIVKATAMFRDHTFKTAISDWPAAWRNWMRRDQTSAMERQARQTSQRDRQAGVAAVLFDGYGPIHPTGEVFDV